LTDEEWASVYLHLAERPEWVNIYLADSLGESRGSGPTLITTVEKDGNQIIPQSQILLNNYPNPFNPYTIISFSIPYDLTNSFVELKIYDINGRLVNTLVSENLSAGNYLTRWDGDNVSGTKVSSGVYIYSIRVGDRAVNKKMTLLK
jgi:flagellar hook assembly protein FlgD